MADVFSVTQVNAYIKSLFDKDFALKRIYVKGEASNVKYHQSGHIYFTIKDAKAALNCVMFAGNRSGLKFRMADGDRVIVLGGITVYEAGGRYQMYAREIVLDGEGQLYAAIEALKQKLAAEGLFDEENKKRLPAYPMTIGVVTAPRGAALQDIINITKRRNPYVRLIIYP
ncbi:MAG: exodeoxyribonuclease VII large subunit, partial [Lachnospiraceae bacterium]|nr:exodeoxyribonuclease VII large subunit [Lachnospiraceae bacterium]